MKKQAVFQIVLLVCLCLVGGMDRFIGKKLNKEVSPSNLSNREVKQVGKLLPVISSRENSGWPNFYINEIPTLLTFETGRIYAVGLKGSEKWKKIRIDGQELYFSDEDFWNATGLKLHPAFDIEGQKAFLFQISKEPNLKHVFAHERFHLYQLKHFSPDKPSQEGYTDHLNQNNLALAKLEDRILGAFLKQEDNEMRLELLKDFLAVHDQRKKEISLSSKLWEDQQQRMEGLADYVAFQMGEGILGLINSIGQDAQNEDLSDYIIKWRHYFTGAALAYGLDFIEAPDWKIAVEKGRSLAECLEDYLPVEADRLEAIKLKFDYAEISKKVEKLVLEFAAQLETLRENYENLEGFPVRIGTPRGLGITGGGSTEKIFSLEDGTTISLNDASSSTTSDSNWKFSTHSMPYLIQNGQGYREFKAEEMDVYLNKRALSLADIFERPGEYPFRSIRFEGENFSFFSEKHPGVLVSDGNSLSIYYFTRSS